MLPRPRKKSHHTCISFSTSKREFWLVCSGDPVLREPDGKTGQNKSIINRSYSFSSFLLYVSYNPDYPGETYLVSVVLTRNDPLTDLLSLP